MEKWKRRRRKESRGGGERKVEKEKVRGGGNGRGMEGDEKKGKMRKTGRGMSKREEG